MASKIPVIFLMGPTAAGKTSLAIELAQRFPIDIISVDSALVYRGMDIGTAKPESEILHEIPHRLIDIRNPDEVYSAGQFVTDAKREILDIHTHGRIPLLVGGTMMYYRSLQFGIAAMPPANDAIRFKLQQQMEADGLDALYAKLKEVDATAATRIHANDAQRIQRALEVFYISGKSITEWQNHATTPATEFDIKPIAIAPTDRSILHERIALRFADMLRLGLIEEVEALCAQYQLNLTMPSMRSVGYRQVLAYLNGEYDKTTMQEKAIAATRQLAKRQLTWLRSWPEVQWCKTDSSTLLRDVAFFLDQ